MLSRINSLRVGTEPPVCCSLRLGLHQGSDLLTRQSNHLFGLTFRVLGYRAPLWCLPRVLPPSRLLRVPAHGPVGNRVPHSASWPLDSHGEHADLAPNFSGPLDLNFRSPMWIHHPCEATASGILRLSIHPPGNSLTPHRETIWYPRD